MMQRIGRWVMRSGVLALIAVLALSIGVAHAEEPPGDLVPTFHNGTLEVAGKGFKSDEFVDITVKVDGKESKFTALAGPEGDFTLVTNFDVNPGQEVEFKAQGNQGTTKAAIATVPQDLGPKQRIELLGTANQPDQVGASALPRAGEAAQLSDGPRVAYDLTNQLSALAIPIAAVALLGVALVGAGFALQRGRRTT